jgi:hypothetical protein
VGGDISLDGLRRLHPTAATGGVRRLRDGVVEDEAVFAYRGPARWRVRHRSGEEIVVDGEDWWTRAGEAAPWHHDRADPGETVHHNGDLQAMLFPGRLPAVADAGSVITSQEPRADGGRRLAIGHREPVEGVVTADVSPDGHLVRLEAREGGVVVIELTVDSWEPPAAELFDPRTDWTPGAQEGWGQRGTAL